MNLRGPRPSQGVYITPPGAKNQEIRKISWQSPTIMLKNKYNIKIGNLQDSDKAFVIYYCFCVFFVAFVVRYYALIGGPRQVYLLFTIFDWLLFFSAYLSVLRALRGEVFWQDNRINCVRSCSFVVCAIDYWFSSWFFVPSWWGILKILRHDLQDLHRFLFFL